MPVVILILIFLIYLVYKKLLRILSVYLIHLDFACFPLCQVVWVRLRSGEPLIVSVFRISSRLGPTPEAALKLSQTLKKLNVKFSKNKLPYRVLRTVGNNNSNSEFS